MTPEERVAMQQALEAIGDCSPNKALVNAAAALREALAEQAEQEPVAWMHTFAGDVQINNLPAECYGDHWTRTPLYAAPIRTKDLTDDAIDDIALESGGDLSGNSLVWFSFHDYYKFARAVIAADREKNK